MMMDWAGYLSFRAAFGAVMDERYHSLRWLDDRVLNGKVLFWRTDDAAIIAEIRDYPTGAKDIHGLIAAGKLQDIVEVLIPQAEAYGRSIGCIAAQIESRPGWVRALKDYDVHQVIVRKELHDGAQ